MTKGVFIVFIGLWLVESTDAHQERMATTDQVWICEEGWNFREVENSPGLLIPKSPKLHRCVFPNGIQEVQAKFMRLTHDEIA